MAQDSWPSPTHNTRNVNDSEYEKIAARFSDDGVWGSPADTSVVYATTGLQVWVRASKYASLRGHAWYSGASDVALTIGANASGSTRIDRVVLQLDRTTWNVRAVVKAGTPGSGAPTLTQQTGDTGVYEIQVAQVTVPNGATNVTVTREELYVGSRVRPTNSTTPNAAPLLGEIEYEHDKGRWRGWNGSSRVTIYDDTGEINLPAGFSSWDAVGPMVGRKVSGIVMLQVNVKRDEQTFQSDDEDGSKICDAISTSLRPARTEYFAVQFTGGATGRLEVRSNGEVWVTHPSKDVTVGRYLRATVTYLAP